ncbi:zf-HC2 domain-containing protein [Pyxidicoccus xibeiensis]|uniref:zf-HC2 domain-containing protein n=1 Tax=Pyxidicoccus xibeiensis TaxID=2906759 RepID=UPI0020A72F92|nr:zf-HC2 domain-containing protein [Pyxidicoccus xibeiensis]MCP3144687.1 zf-HC2 domain-containing protein [Pyxidicoccus xibeiensis]
MAACPDYEVLLDVFATGGLETAETARVSQHVRTCDGCREAVASTVSVLGLAELPPLSAEEKTELDAVPRRTLAAWRRDEQHRGLRRRTLGSLVAAAAVVALMLLVPDLVRKSGVLTPTPETETVTAPPAPEVDAETLAAFEAWAGLEPLDEVEPDGEDLLEDLEEDPDFNLGETL